MPMVIFVVLMCFWLFFGGYHYDWDHNKAYGFGNTLIPWCCVAILGWRVFRGDPLPRG